MIHILKFTWIMKKSRPKIFLKTVIVNLKNSNKKTNKSAAKLGIFFKRQKGSMNFHKKITSFQTFNRFR